MYPPFPLFWRFAVSKLLTSAFLCGVFGLGAVLAAADWPNYRGPGTDATVPTASVPDHLLLTPVWKVATGNSFGQVAVVADKAVVFTERGPDEFAVALDALTGKELWATRIDNSIKDNSGGDGPRSTPSINDGHVYLYSTHMKLACLDLASGKQLWKHDIVGEFGGHVPGWGSAASPVVVDDLVLVVGGGSGKGILAFNKNIGALVWAKTSETLTHATPTVATILGTRQVICFMQSGLVAVEPATGRVLWTFAHPYKTSTAASPVVGGKNGDVVYCSAGYGVGAAACRITKTDDAWAATKLWRTEGANLSHWSTPVYHDGCIYGLFGHNDGNGPLACLDIETGAVKWSQKGFGTQGGLIALDGKLLIQTPAGDLVLVAASPEGFKELGRQNIFKGKNWTAPSFAGGHIYVHNTSGRGLSTPEIACLKLGAK